MLTTGVLVPGIFAGWRLLYMVAPLNMDKNCLSFHLQRPPNSFDFLKFNCKVDYIPLIFFDSRISTGGHNPTFA
jgi:hypothetical protein